MVPDKEQAGFGSPTTTASRSAAAHARADAAIVVSCALRSLGDRTRGRDSAAAFRAGAIAVIVATTAATASCIDRTPSLLDELYGRVPDAGPTLEEAMRVAQATAAAAAEAAARRAGGLTPFAAPGARV